ncbi:pectin acetylesterase-family hydrolase [Pseudomonas aeruginosa]|uniref:pectin acetylesterase-family hydrolase n=1 Tax=Pseudomonas aeruginosa TaxID=287 RepID=UPI003891C24A
MNGVGSSNGYYINSCYAHCQTGTQETWLRTQLRNSHHKNGFQSGHSSHALVGTCPHFHPCFCHRNSYSCQ